MKTNYVEDQFSTFILLLWTEIKKMMFTNLYVTAIFMRGVWANLNLPSRIKHLKQIGFNFKLSHAMPAQERNFGQHIKKN